MFIGSNDFQPDLIINAAARRRHNKLIIINPDERISVGYLILKENVRFLHQIVTRAHEMIGPVRKCMGVS